MEEAEEEEALPKKWTRTAHEPALGNHVSDSFLPAHKPDWCYRQVRMSPTGGVWSGWGLTRIQAYIYPTLDTSTQTSLGVPPLFYTVLAKTMSTQSESVVGQYTPGKGVGLRG